MNPVRMIILGVALLAGVACVALLARGMAASKPHVVAASAPLPLHPMVQVLVAKHDLSVGDHIGETDMGWQAWPQDAVNPVYVTNGPAQPANAPGLAGAAGQLASAAKTAMANPAQGPGASLLGAIVREKILSGEPIIPQKLVRPGSAGVMAVVLDPGMRAMAVPLSAESAAGGFILPGDHVDVVLSRQVDASPAAGGLSSGKLFTATTVLRNVRVLAIDQNTGPQKGEAVVGATATVQVTPAETEKLVIAKAAGQLTLVLRSYADAAGPTESGGEPQGGQGASSLVRVFRNGVSTPVVVSR